MTLTGQLDARFSEATQPTDWSQVADALARAGLYWLTTVRKDGSPHTTPLVGAWVDNGFVFCTGPEEQKARNLARSPFCTLTTGCNAIGEGLDIVVEGEAASVRDHLKLERIAGAYVAKYGSDWRFEVRGGAFAHGGNTALVFEVAPVKAFGFAKGTFGQTRWRF